METLTFPLDRINMIGCGDGECTKLTRVGLMGEVALLKASHGQYHLAQLASGYGYNKMICQVTYSDCVKVFIY